MEQNPSWEANMFSAGPEILNILWTPKVHYRIHKRPPPVPILCQINSAHCPPPTHFLKNNLRLGRLSGLLASGFPHQNPVRISLHPYTCHMSRPTHSYWFDCPNNGEHSRWYNDHKVCVACDWKPILYITNNVRWGVQDWNVRNPLFLLDTNYCHNWFPS